MGLIILCILFIFAYLNPRSKTISVAICCYMVFLFTFNIKSADYENYRNAYDYLLQIGIHGAYEPLYELLFSLCKLLKLTYPGFRLVMGTICVVFTYLAVKKLTHFHTLALAIFMIYPLLSYVVMIRAAVASAIVMYSLALLIKDEKLPVVKFVCGILIATMFHYSSILYMAFLLVKIPVSKKQLLYICVGLGMLLAILWHGTNVFYLVLSKITSSQKVLAWFDPNSTMNRMGFGGISYTTVCIVANIGLSYLSQKCLTERPRRRLRVYVDTADLAVKVSLILVLFVPIMYVHITYLRIFQEVFPVTICACAETWGTRRKPYERVAPVCIMGIVAMIAMLIFMENLPLVQYTEYYYFMPLFENYII